MPVLKSKRSFAVKSVAAAAAAIAITGAAQSAKADIIITQVSPLNGGTAGTYNGVAGYWFTYDALLSFNSEVTTASNYADFTTLYDAGTGTVAVNQSSTTSYLAKDFALSESPTSTPAFRSTPTDAPSLTNLRFTFTGAVDSTIVGGAYTVPNPGNTSTTIQIGTMPVDLGQFQIFSTSDIETYASFDGQSAAAYGSAAGAEQGNNSTTTVPTAVPEPASLALIGMAGTALLARRRKI